GLAAIHGTGLAHNDIGTRVVMWDRDVKQLRIFQFSHAAPPGRVRVVIAAPEWGAPEQFTDSRRTADHRVDLYCLGGVFYNLLTGRRPFVSDNRAELIHDQRVVPPRPPREFNREIPEAVQRIVLKLLEKDPDDRYQTAIGAAADLEDALMAMETTGVVAPFPLGRRDQPDGFRLSERLFGRDDALASLEAALDRVAGGESESIFVSGTSGTGKTALAMELQNAVWRRRGYFVTGAFDEAAGVGPRSGLARAFRGLVRQLTERSEVDLDRWRRRLLTAVGDEVGVLVELLPELAPVVGPTPEVVALPEREAAERISRVFRTFVRSVTIDGTPMVVFLDDLQWADAATLGLIQDRIRDTSIKHLLLICGYRSGDVGPAHPLRRLIQTMQVESLPLESMKVGNLSAPDVAAWIAASMPRNDSAELAELVFERTAGNPYFVRVLMKRLCDDDLVRFEPGLMRFAWDLEAIRALPATGVVGLLADGLQQLPEATRNTMGIAAFLGRRFDLGTMARLAPLLCDNMESEVADLGRMMSRHLAPAVDAGYLVPKNNDFAAGRVWDLIGDPEWALSFADIEVDFAHDRVQGAARCLVDSEFVPRVHQAVGTLLRQEMESEDDDAIFTVVRHLNKAAPLLGETEGRYDLVRLNLRAAERARGTAAFEDALNLLETAAELLPQDSRVLSRRLTFDLEAAILKNVVALGRYDEAEARFAVARGLARGRSERTRLYITMISARSHTGNFEGALALGMEALDRLDIQMPESEEETKTALAAVADRVERRLAGRSPRTIAQLPELEDPEQILATEVLIHASLPAHLQAPVRGQYMLALILDIALEYGVSASAAYAVAEYGRMWRQSGRTDVSDLSWADTALLLLDRFEDRTMEGPVLALVVSSHGAPLGLERSSALIERGVAASDAVGDRLFGLWGRSLQLWLDLLRGKPIPQLLAQAERALELGKALGGPLSVEVVAYRQFALNLMGRTDSLDSLSGEGVTEQDLNPHGDGHLANYAKITVELLRMRLLLTHGRHQQAWDLSETMKEAFAADIVSLWGQLGFWIMRGISGSVLGRSSGQPEHRAAVVHAIAALEGFVVVNSDDYRATTDMLRANLAAMDGDAASAMTLYEGALNQLAARGTHHVGALAAEGAGLFYLEQGLQRSAGAYFAESIRLAGHYGASTLTERLSTSYSALIAQATGDGTGRVDADSGVMRETVLTAARALSSAGHMQSLLETLLRQAVDITGATRGLLTGLFNDEWHVGLERLADGPGSSGPPVKLDAYDDVAHTVIDRMRREGQTVCVDDAINDDSYRLDPWVEKQQIRSVVCVPAIHRGKMVAGIYLESDERASTFSGARVSVVEILAAQGAASIRNDRLVADLREVTDELERTNQRLAEYTRVLERDAASDLDAGDVIGHSDAIVRVLRLADDVAVGDTTVLLQGETGTGKELLARRIHAQSPRSAGAFVTVACRSLAQTGASDLFAAASDQGVGRLALAEGGTLFLDDVSELQTEIQARLVQVLMDREMLMDSGEVRPIDVRVIAGSTSDLQALVAQGEFREDLYYALSVFPIRVPPLRERTDDLPELVAHFLKRLAEKLGKDLESVAEDSLTRLSRYAWPGNVTELRNVLERAAIVARGSIVHVDEALENALDEGAPMGAYRLVERIGAGGMGEVWKANHRLLKRAAAIKIIPPEIFQESDDPRTTLRRFEREAQATADLQSPHTVQLFDYGVSETGTFFYAMELLDGLDLESAIRRFGPMEPERVIHILRQSCQSLAEAHAHGLVHRDIKAANVYLCRLALEVDFVKVLDFGLVRDVSGNELETRLTGQGRIGGTPAYMAPELAIEENNFDQRADLYALGCMAFWLLTGRLVFDAPSVVKMLMAHVGEPPTPPSDHTELPIPPELDALVLDLLAKKPDQRPADAREVIRRLDTMVLRRPWTADRAERWWAAHLPR
ncbi:MAG: transcriptional regulator with GAF, ATPase, and Fis domain, partial [Myxococcota bacterium]